MDATGPLKGLRVVDLSRVLAGPVCTQILGDLGADVIKVEKPGIGDDTRTWGPPFLEDTHESAYYLSANRNKRSVAIDIAAEPEKLHQLLENADVFIENFRSGHLAEKGFGYEQLKTKYPKLIYCSITGFGQNGPMKDKPGYDFLIQGLSGFMANTGPIDGAPSKAGVAIVDYVTGLNAAIAIQAALLSRTKSGKGQHIDLALLDSALAMMTNIGQYALTSGKNPPRVGNAHTTIVPYNAFEASDGWIILTVGNDGQFQKFCHFAGAAWDKDPRFARNEDRVINRDALTPLIADVIRQKPQNYWISGLIATGIPCGPVNSMLDALKLDQVQAREMVIDMAHPASAKPIQLIGSPFKFSDTKVNYRYAPPMCGQNNKDILK